MDMPRRLLTILTVCGLSVLVARVGFAQSISDVIVTDHADSSAVIPWATDAATSDNQVHYGTTSSLGLTALADGDSGETSGSSEAHRVVLDLSSSPGTPYFFRVSSDGIVEDNAGSLYSFTTAQLNISTTLHTVTGKVQDLTGQGLEGVLVVTTITGTTVAHPQSSLTNANGTWFLELNTLRNATTGIKQGFANGNSVAITYRGDGLRSGVDAHTLAQVDITGFDVVPTAQINGAPAPVAAAETTDEDTAFTITLVATDVDGDTPIYSLLDDALNPVTSMTTSAGATVTLSGDVATYTPLTDYATTVEADSFDFFASDGMVDGPSTTVFVTVNPVNDAPVFSLPDNHSGDEDFGAGSVTYSSIGPGGGADEESQTVGMSVVNNSPLIVDIVSSDDAGFTYTTVANASGEATIEVTATDNGPVGSNDVNTSSQTFTITVTAVNDPPVFDPVTSFAVNEDSGSGSVTYVGVGPGGGDDEIGQTVTMTAASLDQGIVEITGFDDAGFSYATLTDVNGPALITVTASDGQAENSTTTESLTITVNALNDAPTFTGPADVFLDEDPGQQTITISDLSPGGGDDESAGQDVTLAAESDDTSIIDTIVVSGDGATRVLTYTPVAEANGGPVYITLTATDNGPTGTDHVNTSSDIFLITVAAVDDPPTFTTPSATDTDEDSPQQSIPITDVGPGGGSDESGQTVTIFAASSDESIIPHPSVTTSGATRTLTYTPEPDASGDVDIELTVDDGTNEVIDTFTITVNAVNDPPTFTVPDDVTLSEDPGAQIITITDVDAGGGTHEDTQTVLVTVSGYDTSLIADIAVDGSGAEWALSFTPVTYANGSTSVTVTADDQQTENNLTTDTFTIEITPVNNKPVYDSVLPQTADEDAGPTEITVTGVGPGGGADEDLQDVTFTATTDNDGIVPDLAVSGEGDTRILTYTPVDDANGTVTIILTASDGQSENSTNAQAFTITVNSVNDEPTFDSVSTDPVDEDSGENFVTIAGIDPGGGTDESDQTVTFEAASDSPSIVPNPTITDGVLSFIPADDANGTVTITLTAMDNGEVAAPNDNTYSDTFTITVNAVDDAPTFDPVDDVQVNEDAGATEVAITGIGIGGGDFEPTQTVELIAKSDNESVVPSPGVFGEEDARTLTFNPEPDANGTAVITVTATDTGSDALPHENTFFRQFTIDVVAVDDAPVFDAIADIGVDEDFGSDSVTFEGVGPGGGSDESGQDVTMHVASEHEDIVEITSFDDT
ncbi:hypothetical protein CMK11_18800, partial [Candidatus Poribacteria bacterium]|nr:hypothetical protein [Candidatus Poribacteria bacterium]